MGRVAFVYVASILVAACGDDGGGGGGGGGNLVAGNANIVHGAKGTSSQAFAAPAAADGAWALTPNKAQLTFTSLTFVDEQGQPFSADLADCKPTYEASSATLSSLADCPFEIPAGTYAQVRVGVSTTYQVLVDDATNGLYTDPAAPTKMSTTAPAGGAQLVSFTAQGPGGMGDVLDYAAFLASPLVVDAEHPVELSIVIDMIHMFGVQISGGVPTPVTNISSVPAMLIPSVSGAGKEEFYSSESSSANLMVGPPGSTGLWGGVRAFYASPPQPSSIFYPVPGPSEAQAVDPAKQSANGTPFKAGGYLGIDSTNTMCWAMSANDFSWQTYDRVCRLPLVTSGTTTLTCQHMTSAPAPTQGDTYASGCPTITPDVTVAVYLIAK